MQLWVLAPTRTALAAALVLGLAGPATASQHTSTSFGLRGATFGSIGSSLQNAASSPSIGASIGASGVSLGEIPAPGLSGGSSDLTSSAPGFWSIVAGALPSLDLDGDGVPLFRDEDDDGDGLLDVHETDTGVFLSTSDTGSDPLLRDSDGDGTDDGLEIAAGTDPNDDASFPASIPTAPIPGLLALALTLAATGVGRLARRRPAPSTD